MVWWNLRAWLVYWVLSMHGGPGVVAAQPESTETLLQRLTAQLQGQAPTSNGQTPVLTVKQRAMLDELLGFSQAEAPAPVYRYRHQGRDVYTNLAESVPLQQRAGARVDLSHVALNSPLGTAIRERLEEAHGALVDSSACKRLRGEQGQIQGHFQAHTPLWVGGLGIVGLLLATPFMLRRVEAAAWRRTLGFAIPALGAMAFVGESLLGTSRTTVDLNDPAVACDPTIMQDLPQAQTGLDHRLQLVQGLLRYTEAAHGVASSVDAAP